MTDIDTLNGIAEWAAYHSHGTIFHNVARMIHEFNGEGIAPDTNLFKRSKFLAAVERIEYINYLDQQSFADVLAVMDELQDTWGDRLLAKGIRPLKWLSMRHEILFEMGIGILRNRIGFDATELSGSIDDIHIDSSFCFKDYKKSIKNLFKSFRKYISGSSDRIEDVTTENEMINKSSTDLCDILERSKKSGAEGDVISTLKIRILLEKHSLKTLNHYVKLFVNRIQNLVLPLPELRLVYDSHTTAETVTQTMRSPDWTEEQRRSSGPYARANGTTARPNEGRRRQSVSMDDRTSRTSSSNRASASASPMEKEEEEAPANYQSSPMRSENTSKRDRRRKNSTARGEEREVDEYVPPVHGTLSKAHNDFNRIVELKDPLPGIIADMAIAPIASRIVHRRSSRHSAPSIVTEYGEAGIRKSPKDAPLNGRALTAGERLSRRIQEEADEEQEDEDDEDDEVLTEDQDSIPVKGSRRNTADKSKGRTRRSERLSHDSEQRARSPSQFNGTSTSSQQKRQLHELDHYMESTTQVAPKDDRGGKKMRLMDTRGSAVRIKFHETEEQEEEIEDQSDADFASGGEVLQQLKRTANARVPDYREYPDRLERDWDQVVGGQGPKGRIQRRKWTMDQETALNDAVAKHGFGNWASILEDEAYQTILAGRTNVNLKDKYRNMMNEK